MSARVFQAMLVRESVAGVRRKMAGFVALAGREPTRCGTCAFRIGTAANQSILVPLTIERCLEIGDTFLCHHGVPDYDDSTRPCAGFVAMRDALATAKLPPAPLTHRVVNALEQIPKMENGGSSRGDPDPTNSSGFSETRPAGVVGSGDKS